MSCFLMPSLGADMEAGTLVEKLVAPGDTVRRGDVIGAVETQKGVIEIEVFEDGILADWLVKTGEKVPVGTPLATIRGAGDPAPPDLPKPKPPEPTPREAPQPVDPVADPPAPEEVPLTDPVPTGPTPEIPQTPDVEIPPPDSQRRRITPAARRLAAERGVDLSRLDVTSSGVISRARIEAAAPDPPSAPDPGMRGAIAAAMSRSKREIPHYYLSHEVDLTAVDAFVTAANAARPPDTRILPGAVYARAVAEALVKYPEFNGYFTDGHFEPSDVVNLGFAITLRGGGLIAPALLDAGTVDLDALMQALRDLVTRVRAGRFRARELSDATITLSSLGERGVDQLHGVIYPPQVAIVGIGTPRLRPWVRDGKVTPRLAATLTLAADHRVSDGRRGASFLRSIDGFLQEPGTL
ncbi:2-oxo acid dehydrogenase subunit E2 [Roseobacter sp. YSTF-M11]|uniref:Dihydrolipoamide acetyltransferase component of pyruvate dehydrogenase complex n=1 Tax=Roseobacter insulae TaxID=2859783 RepID=A0A9X1FR20_9RHOB|nr:dihydrolipoamide acetyltransferase family protein [Roseobacter insulae]MBW4706206.1 2-oxo acid dehydrogenase subunit E2 [Roseobacter insulae]